MNLVGIGNFGIRLSKELTKIYPENYKDYSIIDFPKLLKIEQYEEEMKKRSFQFQDDEDFLILLQGNEPVVTTVLAFCEKIQKNKINVVYIEGKGQIDKICFSVLQEYARSGLFESVNLISLKEIESNFIVGNVSLKHYETLLVRTIIETIHSINYFNNSSPVFGEQVPFSSHSRIGTFGFADLDKEGERKLFFPLDNITEILYYVWVNQETYEKDESLLDKIKKNLSDGSYSIFNDSQNSKPIVYLCARTHIIQKGN